MKLSEKLKLVAEWLSYEDNDLLISAEDCFNGMEKSAQDHSIQPYIAALAGALREYTAMDLTPDMQGVSNALVTFDYTHPDYNALENLVKTISTQPWSKDPAVNKAATDLWQACENEKNKPSPIQANQERSALTIVAEALVAASEALEKAAAEVAMIEPEVITPEALDELAAVAEAFDESSDPLLRKQASVLDAVLELFAKKDVRAAKDAEEKKIDQLKLKYQDTKKSNDERNKIADAVKDIEKAPMYKKYRPLENPLSSRSCVDHPGAQLARIGENEYQCAMDKKIYNYDEGYTTLKGNKVPGTNVSNQTQSLWNNIGSPVFDTRSDRTGAE